VSRRAARRPFAFALLAVLATSAGPVRGDDPLTGTPARGTVADAIERLDDADPRERAAARARLRARGPAVLAELPAPDVARTLTLEQRRALEDVRRAVREDWGRQRTPPGMVYVPAGPVRLPARGRSGLGPGAEVADVPAFYLDRTEVTVGAWRAWRAGVVFVGGGESLESVEEPDPALDPRLPVTNVRRDSAQRYAKEVRGGRLPTREEFLRALRGPGVATWPWGARFVNGRAHLDDDAGRPAGPLPVGSFPAGASRFGVLDLIGNVAEWSDSTLTSRGAARAQPLVWGGHWESQPVPAIAWGGTDDGPQSNVSFAPNIGFRVARAVDPLPPAEPGLDRAGRAR
jgi:formylglycine-generating enzyme required for sulfatase activity